MLHPWLGWPEDTCLPCQLHDHLDCDGDVDWCTCASPDCLDGAPDADELRRLAETEGLR